MSPTTTIVASVATVPTRHRGQRADVGAAPPHQPAEDRHQQAADEDVVGDGQRGDHVLQHAGDDTMTMPNPAT